MQNDATADERAALLDDLTELVRQLGPNADLVTDRIRNVVLAAVAGTADPDTTGARRVMFTDYCDVKDRHDGIADETLDWRQYDADYEAALDVTGRDVDWHRGVLLAAVPVQAAHAA